LLETVRPYLESLPEIQSLFDTANYTYMGYPIQQQIKQTERSSTVCTAKLQNKAKNTKVPSKNLFNISLTKKTGVIIWYFAFRELFLLYQNESQ
jgi:DsbC/DsbD-like thiol-disulfide interchange protein